MSKPETTQDDTSSPDPFVIDADSKGDHTPTQELTREDLQASSTSAEHNDVSGPDVTAKDDEVDNDDTSGGGAAAWGGQDMPNVIPSTLTSPQPMNERSAQTSAFQVSRVCRMYSDMHRR